MQFNFKSKKIRLGAIAVGTGLFIWLFGPTLMGRAIKSGIEKLGPAITKVDIDVDSVRLGPLSGVASISGLTVGNPNGFKNEQAMRLGSLRMKVALDSLASDTVKIDNLSISHPEIWYESSGKGNNLKTIERNIRQFTGNSDSNGKTKNILIKDLVIREATVHYAPLITGGKALKLTLPDIRLENIGHPNGTSPSQVASKVMQSVMGATVQAVGGATKDLTKGIGKGGKKVLDSVKDLF